MWFVLLTIRLPNTLYLDSVFYGLYLIGLIADYLVISINQSDCLIRPFYPIFTRSDHMV